MRWREVYPDLKPSEISYGEGTITVRNHTAATLYPRLAFIRALQEFENEETNAFDTFASGTRVQVDTVIEEDVKIGSNSVIGGHGFGYEADEDGRLVRMPHLGRVIIEKGVTIHNMVNIDRAVLGETRIGEGTVIDSLVHIAHGVKIGKNCAIVSGAVIGGSVEIGNNVFIGMNASIKNKVKIGNNVTIGAGAVVLKDVPEGETWIGNPARKMEQSRFKQRLNEEMAKK